MNAVRAHSTANLGSGDALGVRLLVQVNTYRGSIAVPEAVLLRRLGILHA